MNKLFTKFIVWLYDRTKWDWLDVEPLGDMCGSEKDCTDFELYGQEWDEDEFYARLVDLRIGSTDSKSRFYPHEAKYHSIREYCRVNEVSSICFLPPSEYTKVSPPYRSLCYE